MTAPSSSPAARETAAPRFSLDTWAVVAAVVFVVLIVAGIFPRVPW